MVKNMKRYMMSVSDEMYVELEKERKDRRLETVQEVTRQIVSDYLRQRSALPKGPDTVTWGQ
jgi:metal-responsive CopG/Arc/MetJ family transcriptional regulator